MRKWCCLFWLLALCGGVAAEVPRLFAEADRNGAVYAIGEKIVFKVTRGGVTGEISYTVDQNGNRSTGRLEGETVSVSAKAPGFILLTLNGVDANGKKRTALAGAAVAPADIRPAVPAPANFDAFWERQLQQLRTGEMKVAVNEITVPECPPQLRACEVRLERGGVVATGYLVMPRAASSKSLGAMLMLHGAGTLSASLPSCLFNSKFVPAIYLSLNLHGLANAVDPRDPVLLKNKKAVRDYMFRDADNPEKYPLRNVFLRDVLALDYLRSLPEFNGERLVVSGGSLGGAQALVAAALVPEVSFCVANAAAMCAHHGEAAGGRPGWPDLLNRVPAAEACAGYFDVVNFAPKIKCEVRMAVGFIDVICPPESTYAAYNMLGTQKRKMAHVPTSGHGANIVPGRPSVFACGLSEGRNHCRTR